MSQWRKIPAYVAAGVEEQFDRLKGYLKERIGTTGTVLIQPYLGYGTRHHLVLQGRILEDKGAHIPDDNDTVWQNLLNAYRHIESDEIAGARLRATFDGSGESVTAEAVSDEEGYFLFELALERPLSGSQQWHELALELVAAPVAFADPVSATGRVLVPSNEAVFGVISDIDDTVLQSSATNYLKAARLLFLHNAHTRLPFEGVAAFYQALQQGGGSRSAPVSNPIFYVSSSPWNLYPLLTDFFDFQEIPAGPLFLQDYGFGKEQFFTAGHRNHKLAQIGKILTTYPNLPFVLIGDSGQKDPEIYRQVVNDYPGRICAIYIRDVTLKQRRQTIRQLVEELHGVGVPMVLAADSVAAAQHAAEQGLIDAAALPAIITDKRRDETAPTALEEMLDDSD